MLIEANQYNLGQILSSNGIYIIDFYAPWCGPCKMLSPLLHELSMENTDVHFIKVNIDANPAVAKHFKIKTIPTLAFYKNGQFVDVQTGFIPKNQLQNTIFSLKNS